MDSRETVEMNVSPSASGAELIESPEPRLLLAYKTALWAFSGGTK
jgi:hypothetical protein